MRYQEIKIGTIIYLVGIELIIINKERNMLRIVMLVETLYLGVIVIVIALAVYLDDVIGILMGLYIIIITGLESAIGLGILIGFYRIRGSIDGRRW